MIKLNWSENVNLLTGVVSIPSVSFWADNYLDDYNSFLEMFYTFFCTSCRYPSFTDEE